MTDTPERTTPDMEPGSPTAARRWGLAAGLAVLVVVLIGFAVFAAARADDNDDETTTTQQVAAAQRACQQWLDDASPGDRPGAAWCDHMASWMTDHMRNGQMMGGSAMWDSPQVMRDWCVQATGDGRAGVDDATRWCDLMVDWMYVRRGDPRD